MRRCDFAVSSLIWRQVSRNLEIVDKNFADLPHVQSVAALRGDDETIMDKQELGLEVFFRDDKQAPQGLPVRKESDVGVRIVHGNKQLSEKAWPE